MKFYEMLAISVVILTICAGGEDVSYFKQLQARRLAERTAQFNQYAGPYRTLFLQRLNQFFSEGHKVYTTAERLSFECLGQKKVEACRELEAMLNKVFREAQSRCVQDDLDREFDLAKEIGANIQFADMSTKKLEKEGYAGLMQNNPKAVTTALGLVSLLTDERLILQEGKKVLEDRLQELHAASACRLCFSLQDFEKAAIYMYARYPIVTSEGDESIKHLLVKNEQIIFAQRRQPSSDEKNPDRYAFSKDERPSTLLIATAPFSPLILMAGRMRSAVTCFDADETISGSPFEGVEALEPGEKDLSADHPAYRSPYRTHQHRYVPVSSAYWKDVSSYRWM